MQDLTWLKPLLRKGSQRTDKWFDACMRIRSSVVNPQNKDEIIFLITQSILDVPMPTLFIVNTTTKSMRQLNFEFPDYPGQVYFCQMINVNYDNRIPNVDCRNKLIVIGDSTYHEQYPSLSFLGVLNLNSLTWEHMKTSNVKWEKHIVANRDEMVRIKSEKFFYGNWLFCHQDASLYIFHFDEQTNYLKQLFSIDLDYDYSAMILMPHHWPRCHLGNYHINDTDSNSNSNSKRNLLQLQWISILMCGGETVNFKTTFCLIKISIKHLKQLTSHDQDNNTMNEDSLYKVYYQHCNNSQNSNNNFISNDNIDNIFNNYKSNDFLFKSRYCGKDRNKFTNFAHTLVSDEYLLLLGGELDKITVDLIICYDLYHNKWFQLKQCSGQVQRLIHTLTKDHNALIINKKWLYIIGDVLQKVCARIDLQKIMCGYKWKYIRLLWIEHMKPTNKDTSIFHRMPKDVLKYVIKFIQYLDRDVSSKAKTSTAK